MNIFKQLTRQLSEATNRMMLATLVFLELSKVFDSTSYLILLHKLNSVVNSPETKKSFESYVTVEQSTIGFTLALPVTITHRVP